MDHRTLIETALTYYVAGDVEQVMSMCSRDVVLQLYVSQNELPFGGEARGSDGVRDKYFDMLALFDCLEYDPVLLDVRDGVARVQTQFVYHHRESGERLAGSLRMVCTIEDDLISRIEEHHDEPMMKAFMRLAEWRVAEDGPVAPIGWKLPT